MNALKTSFTSPHAKQGLQIALACAAGWFVVRVAVHTQPPKATPGNRLAYLDELDPYYPHAKFPKLITPQWVGEDGVEAVVILAIDDMRDPAKYEAYLRPILDRLQEDRRPGAGQHHDLLGQSEGSAAANVAQGRAVSLEVPHDRSSVPVLQERLREGQEHLRPLRRSDERDPRQQAGRLPHAVLRFAEHAQPALLRRDLQQDDREGELPHRIDSSVFNVFTPDDPELPPDLVLDADGRERFASICRSTARSSTRSRTIRTRT